MMVYPSMLIEASVQAGMQVPPDPDNFNRDEYPHFHIFCMVQLGRAVNWGEHWENAKVVARIPDTKVKTITLEELVNDGLEYPL